MELSCVRLGEIARYLTTFYQFQQLNVVNGMKIRYGLCNKKVFVPDGLLLFKITENLLNLGSVCVEIRT